ncbi:MAG: hypothetical protein AAGF12_43030 [Myxococcota bacterium]
MDKPADFKTPRERAEELYAEALDQPVGPETIAWLELQRGLMDLERNSLAQALRHYRRADAEFPGWYLVEEHIAEILTLQEKYDEAMAIYTEVVERTGSPEFMVAIAGVHEAEGRPEEATRWLARAKEGYDARVENFPEAAVGHAYEFYLEHSDDVAQLVAMAERNHELRPGADSKLGLAQAYIRAGRADEAQTLVETARSTPYRTADLHAVAALLFEAAGDSRAAEERRLATEIHPEIFDDYMWVTEALSAS